MTIVGETVKSVGSLALSVRKDRATEAIVTHLSASSCVVSRGVLLTEAERASVSFADKRIRKNNGGQNKGQESSSVKFTHEDVHEREDTKEAAVHQGKEKKDAREEHR